MPGFNCCDVFINDEETFRSHVRKHFRKVNPKDNGFVCPLKYCLSDIGIQKAVRRHFIQYHKDLVPFLLSDETISNQTNSEDFYLYDKYSMPVDPISSISPDLDRNQSDLNQISPDLDHNQSDLNCISHDLDRNQSDLNCISHDLDRNQSDLDRNQSDLDRNQSDLNQISPDLDHNQSDLNCISHDLDRNQSDLNCISHDLDRNQSDLNQISSDLDRNQSDLNQISPDLDHNQSDLNCISDDPNSMDIPVYIDKWKEFLSTLNSTEVVELLAEAKAKTSSSEKSIITCFKIASNYFLKKFNNGQLTKQTFDTFSKFTNSFYYLNKQKVQTGDENLLKEYQLEPKIAGHNLQFYYLSLVLTIKRLASCPDFINEVLKERSSK